ncbi:DUF5056 domain-containing protein [Bacteroides helcogenes]|uniref:DUF5056 domain-containing protein n=1 Tax=Bacteroides helcogenes (strain ATCC 35417 / DSM 20613 / JCM 6297 / CCUG 15421 / P 36-108) TaxID=693979 RepID=E6SSG7_BACT6|nr:DUF5056 domain-containing protein [Bacteroides helcogenes]ADV45218.1 hypothetical protein Bache_3295 [Bacteroides helcogenes P 36-108]MDY5238779.1 DUF5056 domain-containing protein [Bacteroides helcogenes]
MMENDDKLLEQFFAGNRQEIADNGFTRRVMHRLPNRSHRLSQIWTAFCFTLALVLFVTLDGLQLIIDALRETFSTTIQSGTITQLDPKSLLIAAVVLIFLGCRKISSLA